MRAYFKKNYSNYLHVQSDPSLIERRKAELLKTYPNMSPSRFKYTLSNGRVAVWFVKDGYKINIRDLEFIHTQNEWKYLHNNTSETNGFPKIWLSNGTIHSLPKGMANTTY